MADYHEINEAFIPRHNWQAAQTFADSHDWRADFGYGANCARKVFQACIERARMSASNVWRASRRELAELANVDKSTVDIYIPLFKSRGWLACPETDKFVTGGASLFLFGESVRTPYSITTCTTTVRNTDGQKMPKTDAEKNIFGTMRGCAWAAYQHLLTSPEKTKAAIARAIKQPDSSVKVALEQLIHAGLVSMAEGAFVGMPVTDDYLETITTIRTKDKQKVVKPKAQLRRARHKAEREINASADMMRSIRRYRDKLPNQ
ncbi:MAG: hypothetical protein WCA79_08790 [Anaerolineales bacterium]